MDRLNLLGRSLSLIGVAVLIGGIYDITQNNVKNSCEMTYMFEMPSYEPVLKSSHGRYSLYLYSEASKRQNVPHRIPVVFIPGNAGSYKQVRSLASVALRMAIDKKHSFEYDFYSIDFNEEFSALYGGFLRDQTDFLMECLEWLDRRMPESSGLILVGHSIGGLIGRNVMAHTNYTLLKTPVSSLIMLATPHRPILLPDSEMDLFYRRLPYVNPKVSYINVGGGERDIQVRSGLALFGDADVNVILSASPGVWVSADHCCIVWCKQFIIAINRALSEIVHEGVLKDKDAISSSFRYHLEQRHYFFKSSKIALENKRRSLDYKPSTHSHTWISQKQLFYAFESKMSTTSFFLISTSPSSKDILFVESFNLRGNWIFGCMGQTESDICVDSVNMYESVTVLPGRKRNVVHLPLDHKEFTHYAIVILKGSENPKISIDTYDLSARTLIVKSSNLSDFLGLPMTLLNKTEPSATFYNLTFPDLVFFWQAYEVRIQAHENCNEVPEEEILGSMHFVNPWSKEVTHVAVSKNTSQLSAKLLSVSSSQKLSHMLVYLNRKCSFRIEARVAWLQSFGQIVRYHFPTIVSLFMSVLLFAIGGQYRVYEDEKSFPSLWSPKILSPIHVLVYLLLASILLISALNLHSIAFNSQAINEPVLHAVLLFISMGCVPVFGLIAWIPVVIGGNALSKVISRLSSLPEFASDYVLDYFWRWSFLICPVLMSVAFASCGSLVLVLGLLLHILKLFKMYESYLQDLSKDETGPQLLSDFHLRSNAMNLTFSTAVLWFISCTLNSPILMTWIRNNFVSLSYDPSLISALILSVTSIRSLSNHPINPNLKGYSFLGYLLLASGFVNILFCTLRVYRINYTLNGVIVAISAHQLWAPKLCP